MRKLILTLFIIIGALAVNAQSKADLQKPIFGIDPRTNYLKDKEKEGDPNDIMTTLPVYTTKDAAGFTFGPVTFTNGGILGPDDLEVNNIGFVVKSLTERTLVGLAIDIEKTDEAKKLMAYVNQKYGKSIILSHTPKPREHKELMGTAANLWREIAPGITMVMVNEYGLTGGKQSMSTTLYIMQDNIKTNPKIEGFKTVLDKIIMSCSNRESK